jgi:hypothetical protein
MVCGVVGTCLIILVRVVPGFFVPTSGRYKNVQLKRTNLGNDFYQIDGF